MYELLRKMKLFAPSSKIQLVYLFRMAKEIAELQIIHFSMKRYVLLKPCNKRVRSSAPQITHHLRRSPFDRNFRKYLSIIGSSFQRISQIDIIAVLQSFEIHDTNGISVRVRHLLRIFDRIP